MNEKREAGASSPQSLQQEQKAAALDLPQHKESKILPLSGLIEYVHACMCVQTCIYVYTWMHTCTHSFTPSLSFRDQVVDHSFMWVRDDLKHREAGTWAHRRLLTAHRFCVGCSFPVLRHFQQYQVLIVGPPVLKTL